MELRVLWVTKHERKEWDSLLNLLANLNRCGSGQEPSQRVSSGGEAPLSATLREW